jgi:hypothetical protein
MAGPNVRERRPGYIYLRGGLPVRITRGPRQRPRRRVFGATRVQYKGRAGARLETPTRK